ncbi:MAG: hypothetical protein K6G91_14620, partial [Kiritimatiellae bacterium]|nr:hypothetical protein [Kiritimatiellia bacterium]
MSDSWKHSVIAEATNRRQGTAIHDHIASAATTAAAYSCAAAATLRTNNATIDRDSSTYKTSTAWA